MIWSLHKMALTSLKSSIHEVTIKFHACKNEKLIRRYFKTLCFIPKSHKKMFARNARDSRALRARDATKSGEKIIIARASARTSHTHACALCARDARFFARSPLWKKGIYCKRFCSGLTFLFLCIFLSQLGLSDVKPEPIYDDVEMFCPNVLTRDFW